MGEQQFDRAEKMLGESLMEKLSQARVILFGVGGVGSWCAESLIRTGLKHITIVDDDSVCESNINRQLMATTKTVGFPKVDVLCERLREISPEAEILPLCKRYTKDTASEFNLGDYDFVLDAIDSLEDKAELILNATSTSATFISAMGAALKMDPTQIQVTEFWKAYGCPLARALRNKFKRLEKYPSRKFKVVFSPEPPVFSSGKGSLCCEVSVFGQIMASLVILSLRDCK